MTLRYFTTSVANKRHSSWPLLTKKASLQSALPFDSNCPPPPLFQPTEHQHLHIPPPLPSRYNANTISTPYPTTPNDLNCRFPTSTPITPPAPDKTELHLSHGQRDRRNTQSTNQPPRGVSISSRVLQQRQSTHFERTSSYKSPKLKRAAKGCFEISQLRTIWLYFISKTPRPDHQSRRQTWPATRIPPPTQPLELVEAHSPLKPSTTSSVDPIAHPAAPPHLSQALVLSPRPLHKTNVDACQSQHSACLAPLLLNLLPSVSVPDEVAYRPIAPTPSMRVPSMMTTAPPPAAFLPHPSHAECHLVHKPFEHEREMVAQEQMVDLPHTLSRPRQIPPYPQSHRVPEAEK